MKNCEELIWKYLDGMCTEDELVELQSCQKDNQVHELFLEISAIHKGLRDLPAEKAPSDLIALTLSKLEAEKIRVLNIAPIDYRPFFIIIATFVIASLILLAFKESAFENSSPLIGYIMKYVPDLSIEISFPVEIIRYLAILFIIPVVFIADSVLIKLKSIRPQI